MPGLARVAARPEQLDGVGRHAHRRVGRGPLGDRRHLAESARRDPWPRAASCVTARAAATSRAISASMNRRPCCSASGAPNALRCREYRAAASSPARAIPTQAAAIEIRPSPAPTGRSCSPRPPRRAGWPTGTSAPSKTSSAAGQARIPIFFSCAPNRNPGVPFSTRNAVIAFGPARRIERREDEVAVRLGGVRDPDLGPGQPIGGRGVGRADALGSCPDRRRRRSRRAARSARTPRAPRR